MSLRDDEFHIRPGRARDGGRGNTKTFVGQVLRAAQKAGHVGPRLGVRSGRSTFGRGRIAATAARLRNPSRRVLVKTRIVRHRGARFRSASLATHAAYLKRDGVTRSGEPAQMFDARSDTADDRAFAAACEDDRHHFRLIVSPEDATDLADLRATTRALMKQMESDLGTRLEWVAVDHWNTDNPHVHILVRGRADDGADLIIARDYLTKGLRGRAEALVEQELGPRTALEIADSLAREVTAERFTGLDRALRAMADESGGVVDLRPGGIADRDPEMRRLLLGRAQHLERLGLAESQGPASWTLAPAIEEQLRDLGMRGDIIKTMHRAMAQTGVDRGADVAMHLDTEAPAIVGRLIERGLHDELSGSAYAVIDGVDGRVHHVRFRDLEATGDAAAGAIVELRRFEDRQGVVRTALAVRSDLSLSDQITAPGATWLDRQLVAKAGADVSEAGFGRDVRDALDARAAHLAGEGLARRQGQRTLFARDLIETLRAREVSAAGSRLAAETGSPYQPSAAGEHVTGAYRQRVNLASGRFAMIDNGLGFQLVPWTPAIEPKLGQHVSGVVSPGGGVDWSFGRKRGLGL
ncbi:MAG: type VI secretion protein [Sphingomonas sp. 28-62-20]|uniref:relaxase/mobilization nuclease domain-containing protein n=1 Tax=Sphingomonas sp. 28-62-20 TaxID=1970433 RepID=UPI000BDD11D9|nr:MAG: type VI secretion protein [Sphingomonas sp. 28-62-20]